MISASAAGRMGTGEDIVAAVDFLTGPHATFITGTDLLVDGGVIAAHRNGLVQHQLGLKGKAAMGPPRARGR
jgi:hypothetical protein